MKRELKQERERRGRGRKDSFFFRPQPFPALLLAPFFARSLTLVPRSLLLNRTETLATHATYWGAPGAGWGGTPDNGKLFLQQWPNHAHEYNQSDSGLAFLLGKQHTLVRKNT